MNPYTIKPIPRDSYKKILVRAGFNPLIKYSPCDFFSKNLVGDNLGNLMFAYGAMNVLWTENTTIKQIYDKPHYSDEEVDYINRNFDVFVMPMADAFRPSYLHQLRSYIDLIRKLKIPVIVLGIGLRTTYEPQFCINPELDSIVKLFVSTVLDHSHKLGLRGEITATYLSKLGFKEDRDFVPIGCPSLYTYGDNIHIKKLSSYDNLKRGKLIFNSNTWAKNHFNEFIPNIDSLILGIVNEVPNHFLIQQKIEEFKYLYFGKLFSSRMHFNSIFTDEDFNKLHQEDRVRCFTNVPSWIKFCQNADLFVGNRFHGAVAAILSGTPHIFLPFDGRTRELSKFHHLTSISPDKIKEKSHILDFINTLDFNTFDKYLDSNLKNYIEFLDNNNLPHIFKQQFGYESGMSPMERLVDSPCKSIPCMESMSLSGKTKRIISCIPFFANRVKSYINS